MKTQAVREGDIAVLPFNGGVDVFTGLGWSNWSRFETKGGYPKLTAGRAVSEKEYSTLYKLVSK